MSNDTILEATPSNMLAQIDGAGTIASWTEDKKQEFVDLFEKRSKAAQYILQQTATIIIEKAHNRHFIGVRAYNELKSKAAANGLYDTDSSGYHRRGSVGGRSTSDLNQIAEERANLVLNELPPIKTAVQVIDPDTAKMMDDREKLLKKLRELKTKLEEMPNAISMKEVDQKMTVGDFLKGVKALEKKRRDTINTMCDVGSDGQELDSIINKRLYNGLPGLSDAVRKVATQYIERSKALDSTTRRVEERVKFGDDEGAQELLKGFEKDEVTISDNVKAEFSAALGKLNLLGAKRKKALPKPKKKGGKKK